MAVASIAPALVGDMADILGRRPVYILTLSVYSAANMAIALTRSYPSLLGLRVIQALSISGTFSIAYGVVTDVASPAERGSYAALVSFATTIAPSIGPILGGALTFAAGWWWTFWFLCIASSICLTVMVLFLPETSRHIVGDGSIPPPRMLQLPIPKTMNHWQNNDLDPAAVLWRVPNPLKSFTILWRKDNAIIIVACGLLYVIYTCINASLSTLFVKIYNLNQWEAGLIYLPFGIGGSCSAFISGRILDQSWHKARQAKGLSTDKAVDDNLDTFPVEKARLRVIWAPMLITTCLVIGFGWILHYHKFIAIPLVFQFFLGLVMQLDFSIYNTLLVDKNNRAPAAAQASSNIVRGAMAAIAVSFLQDMIDKLGIGWTFTFMGGLSLLASALFWIDYEKGAGWRQMDANDGVGL
ncbi:hypothetical protein PENCOP_c003G04449 [Penicillium coprophilum]|uniref:Major facilitator superfamily (MFS) profile domain-containing protein n=1 Tax=Penicillium coprophilum TaxID=36646 RepID=A0A1V6UY99_9EURO|nr:hypothetical protein PENCOP_c003G04449 [Penicillium coprophilum]